MYYILLVHRGGGPAGGKRGHGGIEGATLRVEEGGCRPGVLQDEVVGEDGEGLGARQEPSRGRRVSHLRFIFFFSSQTSSI